MEVPPEQRRLFTDERLCRSSMVVFPDLNRKKTEIERLHGIELGTG